MNLNEKTLQPQIDALLRRASAPITSYALADALLSRHAEPWEWFAIDGVLMGMIINGDDVSETTRIRTDKPRGKRIAYRWQRAGVWYFCHVSRKFEFGACDDDTAARALQSLSAARDEVIGNEPTVKRGRPPKPRPRESVYTLALNY